MTRDCVSPPEVDEKQLLMYLDGEANKETVLHLERCTSCRERAEALNRFQNRLKSRVYRVTCPTSIELGEYHLRMLPASQMLVISQHVNQYQCPLCTRELSELEKFLADLSPEADFVGTAKVLFARLIGIQTEGDFTSTVPALRGESRGPLTFETDGMVITLDVQQAPNGQVSLLGQVAADEQDQWTGAIVELQRADSAPLNTSLDDLGGFRFEEVRPGSIQIIIKSLNGIHVQIPNIDIAI